MILLHCQSRLSKEAEDLSILRASWAVANGSGMKVLNFGWKWWSLKTLSSLIFFDFHMFSITGVQLK